MTWDHVLLVLGLASGLVVLGLVLWPSRPPPVVGQILPFPDPKRRPTFRSARRKHA